MIPMQVFAHALWTPNSLTTPPRNNSDGTLKVEPCGALNGTPLPRVNNPKNYKAGEIITGEFVETIHHNGIYLISYSPANDSNFIPLKINNNIIIPHNVDDTIKNYSVPITLPIELCDDCTLQLIQEMWGAATTRPEPNGPNGTLPQDRTYYYSCSDIILTPPNPNNGATQDPVTLPITAPGDTSVTLSWKQPTINVDFYKILIVGNAPGITPTTTQADLMPQKQFKVNDIIPSASNDTVVYVGKASTATIKNLINNKDYRFQIFAYDINLNYSTAVLTNIVTPSAVNVAPTVSLAVKQGNTNGTTVFKNGTNIVVTATVTDGNPNDNHTYVWQSAGNNLSDIDNIPNTFTIDPANLNPSTYTLTVEATDNATTPLMGTTSVVIILENPPIDGVTAATTSNNADSGGCSLSPTAKFDPLLLLLAILSIGLISFRARKKQ